MTRRIAWSLVAALALGLLGATWFLKNFERVPVESMASPGPEARRDPYLALKRFMTAMGRPLTETQNTALLNKLPAGGVLILDNNRRVYMSPARVTALLDWVRRGGYLIVVPEPSGIDDPILDFFDVNCGCDKPKPEPGAEKPPKPPESIAVTLPGATRTLHIEFVGSPMTLGKVKPDWQAAAPGFSPQLIHFTRGKGHVTLLSGFFQNFNNRRIGRLDHAELLWRLIETYQPDRTKPLTLMTRFSAPTLWQWLAESAWTALAAAAALLALCLWAVVPRFGLPRPEPEMARRELGEHLSAIGRYVWRSGGLAAWVDVARESFKRRLALRHPALLDLPPAEQAAALAELTQRPVNLIAAALHHPADSPSSFTAALRTLRALERNL